MRWEYYDWLPVMLLALTIFFTWLSCWKVEYLKDDTGDGILDFYTRLSNKYVRFSIFSWEHFTSSHCFLSFQQSL